MRLTTPFPSSSRDLPALELSEEARAWKRGVVGLDFAIRAHHQHLGDACQVQTIPPARISTDPPQALTSALSLREGGRPPFVRSINRQHSPRHTTRAIVCPSNFSAKPTPAGLQLRSERTTSQTHHLLSPAHAVESSPSGVIQCSSPHALRSEDIVFVQFMLASKLSHGAIVGPAQFPP